MNREEFGELVEALRKEHTEADPDLRIWSREVLADKATKELHKRGLNGKILPSTISKIERGELKQLNENLLVGLADALRLTIGERRQFFAAAAGVSNEHTARQGDLPLDVLDGLCRMMESINLPAYISDVYTDMIAANAAIPYLYGFSSEQVSSLVGQEISFNILGYIFTPEYQIERMLPAQHREAFIYHQIIYFREVSLPYRTEVYFRRLLSRLLNSAEFRRYWYYVYYYEPKHTLYGEYVHLNHPEYGQLTYVASIVNALTRAGNLQLCIYVPACQNTIANTGKIMEKTGTEIIRLASWPEKPV